MRRIGTMMRPSDGILGGSTPQLTWTQQGSKLVGTGGISDDDQGTAVALNSDGNTLIVGGDQSFDGNGAVWVFTRSAAVWTQQQKLTVTPVTGTDFLGCSVSVSDDGDTLVAGAWVASRAFVFIRSAGVWSQQGGALVGTGGSGSSLGFAVAISGDGDTVLSGDAGSFNPGEVFVFTRSAGVWSQQTKLTPTGSLGGSVAFGTAVALSQDGNTAVVGANGDGSGATANRGAAYIFTRSAGVWTQQQRVVPSTGSGTGYSVAVTADGNTLAMGQFNGGNTIGQVVIFTRSAGVWTQRAILTPNDATFDAQMGFSVALKGSTLVTGGIFDGAINFIGATWVFHGSGASWTQVGSKLIGTGATGQARQGVVALAGDEVTLATGGINDNSGKGATWIFIGT